MSRDVLNGNEEKRGYPDQCQREFVETKDQYTPIIPILLGRPRWRERFRVDRWTDEVHAPSASVCGLANP
eukprot:scaffold13742_cov157-Amphora_coffeaeformis.AAC.2